VAGEIMGSLVVDRVIISDNAISTGKTPCKPESIFASIAIL
jgi:hypothetical protein